MEQNNKEKALQWHPAFYAGLQIEFAEEADKLEFENEHMLATKPMQIDVLVIKKKSGVEIQKNIGRIFRTYNIIEYKSPDDYLSIDDYYKVYGYACFYKSDVRAVDSVKVDELTITFVSYRYPKKLLSHLEKVRGLNIKKQEVGIYYIQGEMLPVQMLVTSELSKKQNLWLGSLAKGVHKREELKTIFDEYGKHKNNVLYESVIDVIIHANKENFKEENTMSKALEELYEKLMKDKIEAREKAAVERGLQQGMQRGLQTVIEVCKNLGASWEKCLGLVMDKFSLSEVDAKRYLKQYWD